ncbi:hypothetical protein KY290_018366 [Solanum tuberosum]|uniref:BED-type domain-containing protein n=1 Tax=Solanum tuberosum TaxID=4113 RepID=A0ABQ7VG16_SOLTU|nr:hypothetical protein KY284_017303 [Solanum tuberosum]KAH0703039.1 hypothetical protein KY285_017317 [Solanum tuberosum]KAH0762293.1 hypothetical protein KY290_018366 [Solanum tuberosum]
MTIIYSGDLQKYLVVREKDVCWEYAEKLDGNKVRCKFCLRILNGGISRLKHHLSRLPSKGVNPCTKVRDDVTDRVRDIIGSKEPPSTKKHKLIETKALANISPEKLLLSVEPITPIARIFPPIGQAISSSGNNQENAERSIALFFFENKIDFGVARSSSYHQMIEAVGKCGSGFIGPSPETLKATWLERIKSEVSLQSKDVEKEWAMTGCTLIAETWTDNKMKALINFLVSSPSRTFFYKSVDASSYFKNLKCLSELFDSIIQDFGPENVVQAQSISKFIYNNSPLLDLMKKFTGGQEIIKTGITKSVSNFLSLQCLLKHRSRLKVIFNSPELAANSAYTNKSQSVNCIAILDDNDFWRTAEECVAVSEPFLKVMREVSGGKPAVGTIYELLTRAKESIRTYYIMDEIKCKTFLDIVDKNWKNNLHSPLHSAAAFLNPGIQYNREVKFLGSIKEDFFRVLEKLLPTPELRRDITTQILLYTRASGMFGCNLAKEAIDTVPPGIWWEQYGDAAPTLQRVAIKILSQVCSTFTFERHWSTFQQIHSEKRNKIDKETLLDLVYINYNLKLARYLVSKPPEEDPLQLDDIDMTSEWVEEAENPSPTQWLDRFGSGLDGNDLNTRQFTAAIFGPGDNIFGL